MSYLDFQFEILRGQIEELQGRLEEMLALRRGRGGMLGSLRGRSRRLRGRARQTYARARYGAFGLRRRKAMPSMPSISMPTMPNISMPSMPNMPNLSMPKIPGVPMPRPKSAFSGKYVFLAVGVMLVLTAVLWPGLLSGALKQANGKMSRTGDPQNDALTNSEL